MDHFVEFRSYNLKPGTHPEFHRLFIEEAMPLLQRFHVDVVAYGTSLHDENSCYLIAALTAPPIATGAKSPFMAVTSGDKVRARRSLPVSKITLNL